MDAWLLSWMPAGRNFVDRVVTILPSDYEEQDVAKILEALFYVGSLTLDETAQMRGGAEMQPQTHRSVHANNYIRLVIELGSFAMEARKVRKLVVTAHPNERISWEEQNHDGSWVEHSFTRTETGQITFSLEG